MYEFERREDITNVRFGKLVSVSPVHNSRKWICRCDCGTIKEIDLSAMRRGSTTSCGCAVAVGIDITGDRYGKLTAIEFIPAEKRWKCKCDCGNYVNVNKASLRKGTCKSCGCLAKPALDITNIRYGKLVAVNPSPGGVKWMCKCDCGKMHEVAKSSLIRGSTKSCGCLAKERIRQNADVEYIAWQNMLRSVRQRLALDPHASHLQIQDNWNVFANFYLDMGSTTPEKRFIVRLNLDRGYSKDNCVWSDTLKYSTKRTRSKT